MNIASIIEGHPDEHVAIVSRNRETTYATLRDQVARLRGGRAAIGVGAGDRVALLCGNGRFFVEAYLAVAGLGAVTVPLNPTSPAPEIEREIVTVAAKVVLVDPVAAQAWTAVDRARVPTVEHVVATEPGTQGAAFADSTFAELVTAEPLGVVDVDEDTLAALIFTSGTAGSPRAAMLSHGNLLGNLNQSRSAAGELYPEDVIYGVLPLFHIFGLNVVLGTGLQRGATVVLVQRFDPSTAIDTIRDRKISVIFGAPPLWLSFSQFDEAPADSFSGVRLALTGAARMPEDAIRRLKDRFGIELAEGYGLTEASPVVTSSAGQEIRPGSVGKAVQGLQVRIVDEQGEDVLVGDTGEIWVKGPNVFMGYLDDPQQTARVLTADGWLRTGDIALADEDGYLYLVDRAKDLIIVSGFNVYPAEVEEILAEHPAVHEVGVVGVPHPHTGEAVKAFVVPADGKSVDEDTLIDWCQDHLARYKCPSKILFVDVLPRNVNGKLLRVALN
ncbi:MAG: acyl-CoA synthetase (AMP-forming)/AMP-acid ligase [Ilumatobacteraceae bacterium]|nr:acyl-CoA synthetase (AMP-forming)/AMP-acid ligase [Ilumatobacteraceae bacterium]